MKLNTIEEIIADIKAGKMVVIMDDEDRENEGDLIMAASEVKTSDINFMATEGRGLICLTLTKERCQQLRLPLMVSDNQAQHSTNFTVSIEAAEGVTTGISAADRAVTVQAAVAVDAKPVDIVQPGHIFPLMAQSGGVLNRAGHTEAGCDLSRLAGLEPASVIVEILNEDGTMARRPDLEVFAQKHKLKIGTIESLIKYRIENEKTIEKVAETDFPTEFGHFHLHAYSDTIEGGLHLALVKGTIDSSQPIPVRVHVENLLCDLFKPLTSYGWPLQSAMKKLASMDSGVLVILREPEDVSKMVRTIQDYQLNTTKHTLADNRQSEKPEDLRTFGIGAQILSEIGVKKMRLMSAPKVFHGLAGFGLEVVDYITD